jgi:myo-inositol-1(or 4)-monophosphatase
VADAPPPLLLATAIEAVTRAGEIQLAHFGREIRVDKKGVIDLVTEIDIEIERGFRAMIAERFPDHDVLGEEFGASECATGIPHFCWVFDPIDGTTNYAHRLPIFCSSLAFEVDGEPVVAAIYDPTRKELFTAERGQGAWLNGAPLRVSSAATLIDSLLVTGFHYDVQKDPGTVIDLFAAFISRARAVRRLGSAALDLAYVAAGRFDGFWERRLQPWDVAAGALIVAEAGGQVTAMSGGRYACREGSVLATNGLIHEQMLETIASI